LFDAFGLPVRSHLARLYTDELPDLLARGYFPGRTAPTMRTPEGTVVPETIAIAEELASRHPAAGIWPADPHARATARVLAAEMHAGFAALRSHCPMNLRVSYTDCEPPPEVLADLARLETLWGLGAQATGSAGPWLCGAYSAADAFFAPVASRIAGYNLPVGSRRDGLCQCPSGASLVPPLARDGLVDGADQDSTAATIPAATGPAPYRCPPMPSSGSVAENAACPYSGKPVTHVLELGGRRFGFCNAFCRDKTVADPEAWPEVHGALSPFPRRSEADRRHGEGCQDSSRIYAFLTIPPLSR
jgi:glutathione S-transferase